MMTSEEIVQYVRDELARLESHTTYTDAEESSRWGEIGALERILEHVTGE